MTLSLYLVTAGAVNELADPTVDITILAIAESANQAQTQVADAYGYTRSIIDVGRLGKYEPGSEGHALVSRQAAKHDSGTIILFELTR